MESLQWSPTDLGIPNTASEGAGAFSASGRPPGRTARSSADRVDITSVGRENLDMSVGGARRRELEELLSHAYRDGLISQDTHAARLELVIDGALIDSEQVVGDLCFRAGEDRLRDRVSHTMTLVADRLLGAIGIHPAAPGRLLGLDWAGEDGELLIGRSRSCDIVLEDPNVSRRHARLIHRDGRWVLQDLASTNGTHLNGRRVGRCELRVGDLLLLGNTCLQVD
jgi:hypothetical protein